MTEFYNDKSKKHGVSSSCKQCTRARAKEMRGTPEEKKKARDRLRKWRLANAEHRKKYNADWRAANPEDAKRHQADYRARHPERVQAARDKWAAENPERIAELARQKAARRRETPKGRLESAVRAGVYIALKSKKGSRKTFDILGYTIEQLMRHLERLFEPGMSWENYGRVGWEVDHIIPLSAHNYNTDKDEDFKKAWSLKNLRPLWMTENRKKNAKLERPFQPSLAFSA